MNDLKLMQEYISFIENEANNIRLRKKFLLKQNYFNIC
jgi:hypothetical protein